MIWLDSTAASTPRATSPSRCKAGGEGARRCGARWPWRLGPLRECRLPVSVCPLGGQGERRDSVSPWGVSPSAEGTEGPGRCGAEGSSCRVVATTQMQAPDARKAFPCFDEPAMKAVFTVTMIHPSDHKAISNMPVHSEWGGGSSVPGGRAGG